MAALAERRIIPHEELEEARTERQEALVRPEYLRLLEALLFAASEPLDEKTLKARLPEDVDVREALRALQAEYAPRGVNLVHIANKWTFRTADDLSWLLTKEAVVPKKLSRAAIETLAVIAYHQPVTRAEVEEIRGVVMSKGTIDVLMETGWIRPRGRRKAPGRPITYGTTEDFPVAFRAGGAERSAGSRRVEGLGPARQPPAAGLCGADAVRRSGAARGRGSARAGRPRSRPRAARRGSRARQDDCETASVSSPMRESKRDTCRGGVGTMERLGSRERDHVGNPQSLFLPLSKPRFGPRPRGDGIHAARNGGFRWVR